MHQYGRIATTNLIFFKSGRKGQLEKLKILGHDLGKFTI